MPWEYIGAGMYFYLDNQDRAIVPTTENSVQVIQIPEPGSKDEFKLVREYDLSAHIVPLSWPHEDSVAWVLPDWSGAYYWFATTAGMVGNIHVHSGEVNTFQLDGEIIEKGTHEELLAQQSFYHRLYMSQFKGQSVPESDLQPSSQAS